MDNDDRVSTRNWNRSHNATSEVDEPSDMSHSIYIEQARLGWRLCSWGYSNDPVAFGVVSIHEQW